MERIAGAILAGGASRRMGRTKALIRVDGVPMAERVAVVLEAGGCDGVALVGGSADELAVLGRSIVHDRYPGQGPVGGVITALRHFDEASHVLVAGCDLPMLDVTSVRRLLDVARRHPDVAVVVAHTDRAEPVLAVWNRAALDAVERRFDDGERAMHRVLAELDTQEVPVEASTLLNVNRPDDVPPSDGTCH